MSGNPHIRRAPRLEDSEGTPLAPGDPICLRYGNARVTGTVTIEETYVVRLDGPTPSGTVTETLRHWPNERLKELGAIKQQAD